MSTADLLHQLEQAAIAALGSNGERPRTLRVMQVFGDLGKSLGYHVLARKMDYLGAYDGQWLYDMLWSDDASDGTFLGMPMVLESKLGRSAAKAADVERDFDKLVQARADVRVWVTTCPNQELAQQQIANCKRQACAYRGALPRDAYLFVVYEDATSRTTIEVFRVPEPSHGAQRSDEWHRGANVLRG